MTDLREKLLKAGLVSQEQAQAVASAEAEKARQKQQARGPRPDGPRQDGGDRGGRGEDRGGERRDNRGGDRGPRNDQRGGPREQRPQNDRPRQPDNDGKRLSGEEVRRLVEIAQKGKIDQKVRGHRRWYFESRKGGLVPCIEVSDEAAQQLENGTWRICETPRGEVWLVDADTARELIATDPLWVR